MDYTLTILEGCVQKIRTHLIEDLSKERAGYLFCRVVESDSEYRLLAREFIPVVDAEIISSSKTHMEIKPSSYTRAMNYADKNNYSLVFVHSHPGGFPTHSKQDDEQEAMLFKSAFVRIHGSKVHGSIVFNPNEISSARVWLPDGNYQPIEKIMIVGQRFKFLFLNETKNPVPEFFDRQVRAFGKDIQALLSKLTIGVVGVGGTGSSLVEQLTRLGVGNIIIADDDKFEKSNVSRIFGSSTSDNGREKVDISAENIERIGLKTKVNVVPKSITYESALKEFIKCDVIFGCTDDQYGRSLLTRLAIYYGIPVIDMGVKVVSENEQIETVTGRVTTLFPGTACLFCRGRIDPDVLHAEILFATDPENAKEQLKEGYIKELEGNAPSVVMFTNTIASIAVNEFMHRLTGYMGDDRKTTEVLFFFDQTRIRTNSRPPGENCICNNVDKILRGTTDPLLDSTWRTE